jgi:threonine dehydratase
VRTPAIRSDAISRLVGGDVWLKLDNLKATGAFKERGAANRLALLSDAGRHRSIGRKSRSGGGQARLAPWHRVHDRDAKVHACNEGYPYSVLGRYRRPTR